MKYHDPLKRILSQTRPHWDREEMRPAVRRVFGKALQCRTAELGAEVYSSENQEFILYHTCKSRACPAPGVDGQTVPEAKESFEVWVEAMLQSVHRQGY